MELGVIYGIAHRQFGRVFYVGQTRQAVEERFSQHFRGRSPVSRLLRMLGDKSDFDVRVLEVASTADLNAREAFWIKQMGTLHPNGLNQLAEGNGRSHSAMSKKRMSEAMRRVCADPEYMARVSTVRKRMWTDEAYRNAVVAGSRKARAAPQHKEKISRLKKDMWKDETRKQTLRSKTAASWRDPAAKAARAAAISAALKQRWATPEGKAKLLARPRRLRGDRGQFVG